MQGLFSPVSKGQQLIVIHAGGEQGFIPNAYVRFRCHQKTGTYHSDMNYTNYKKWLKEQLINNLLQNSILVIDLAPYHNVQLNRAPNSHSRRDFLISWLKYDLPPIIFSNTDFPSLRIADIYNMILPLKPRYLSYTVDGTVAEHHPNILRFPSYHSEFKPIELMWATVKNWVAQNNTTFWMDDVITLADQKLASIPAEDWRRRCEHIRTKIEQY
jgi:hypothetical protein